jgi:hypothetical protein
MSGRARLPAGEPRKASQRNTRRAAPTTVRTTPSWHAGDKVRWQGQGGIFRRDVGDGGGVEPFGEPAIGGGAHKSGQAR